MRVGRLLLYARITERVDVIIPQSSQLYVVGRRNDGFNLK